MGEAVRKNRGYFIIYKMFKGREIMKKILRLSNIFNTVVSYVGAVFFVILIVACVVQVFFRFVLNDSLSWTEELARYAFIWMHMIGASLLITGDGHATVTAILDLLGESNKKKVDTLIEVVIFIDGILMTYAGLYLSYVSRTNLSTAMSVPMWYINSSVFVGGILLILQSIAKIIIIHDKSLEQEE